MPDRYNAPVFATHPPARLAFWTTVAAPRFAAGAKNPVIKLAAPGCGFEAGTRQERFCRDERDPNPLRRYKMGFLSIDWEYQGPREGRFRAGQRRGLGVAASPDGIHWNLIESFASEAICDGATHWMFDERLGKHILYGRTLQVPAEIEAAWSKFDWYKNWYSGRAVLRITPTNACLYALWCD